MMISDVSITSIAAPGEAVNPETKAGEAVWTLHIVKLGHRESVVCPQRLTGSRSHA